MSNLELPVYHDTVVRWQKRRLFTFTQRPKTVIAVLACALATCTFLYAYPSSKRSSDTYYIDKLSPLKYDQVAEAGKGEGGPLLGTARKQLNHKDVLKSQIEGRSDSPKDKLRNREGLGNVEVSARTGEDKKKNSNSKVRDNVDLLAVTDDYAKQRKSSNENEASSLSGPDVLGPPEHLESSTSSVAGKRAKVKEMAQHAWNNYVKYAWGANEVDPVGKDVNYNTVFGRSPTGATIVDSLDTLHLMGMQEEYLKASKWVKEELDFDNFAGSVSLFEVNIRYLGGLLSAYAITKDEAYKAKAVDLANRMLPAFDTPSGIPIGSVLLKGGGSKAPWSMNTGVVIAEFGTLHLEWMYLSHITGDPKYMDKMKKIRSVVTSIHKPEGLIYNAINPQSGHWQSQEVSLGGTADSFYEYLIKSYVMTEEKDTEGAELFFNAIQAMENKGLLKKTSDGFWYFAQLKGIIPIHRMGHLACFAGGAFALASMHSSGERKTHYEELAKEITKTCHESYARTSTHIGPEEIMFTPGGTFMQSPSGSYILRPETVESYFYLWRLTHDQKYRDWGWDLVQSLEKYSRVDGGYAGLLNVYNEPPGHDHVQQSFFLSETLKYLYLLFSDDSVYPLDKWVFNTEAHPLPVLTSMS